MTLIEHIEVGSGGASSIEFTGIDQTGTHLVLLLSARSTNTGSYGYGFANIEFNGDQNGNYSYLRLRGDGSTVASATSQTKYRCEIGLMPAAVTTANTFSNSETIIANYTSSTVKTISTNTVTENNATDATQEIVCNKWDGSALTSMIISSASALAEYSTASLYMITE